MPNEAKVAYLRPLRYGLAELADTSGTAPKEEANTAPLTTYQTTRSLDWDLSDNPSSPKDSEKMSDLTREEMKAEIAASEARGETKIARIEGKIDLVLAKLGDVNENVRSSKANQWVIGLGLAVLIVGVIAIFPVFFDMGTKMHDMIEKMVHDLQH